MAGDSGVVRWKWRSRGERRSVVVSDQRVSRLERRRCLGLERRSESIRVELNCGSDLLPHHGLLWLEAVVCQQSGLFCFSEH